MGPKSRGWAGGSGGTSGRALRGRPPAQARQRSERAGPPSQDKTYAFRANRGTVTMAANRRASQGPLQIRNICYRHRATVGRRERGRTRPRDLAPFKYKSKNVYLSCARVRFIFYSCIIPVAPIQGRDKSAGLVRALIRYRPLLKCVLCASRLSLSGKSTSSCALVR